MKIELIIDIEPLIALALICAVIALYAIKRGYDWSRQQMEAKAKQGERID